MIFCARQNDDQRHNIQDAALKAAVQRFSLAKLPHQGHVAKVLLSHLFPFLPLFFFPFPSFSVI
jgi:hypothetical protein